MIAPVYYNDDPGGKPIERPVAHPLGAHASSLPNLQLDWIKLLGEVTRYNSPRSPSQVLLLLGLDCLRKARPLFRLTPPNNLVIHVKCDALLG